MEIIMTDILIVGAGPAGLTAAVYACRAGMQVTVFDKSIYGGQAAVTKDIENFPAIENINGADFSHRLYKQALKAGADIRFEEVRSLKLSESIKTAETSSGSYQARAVILAHGVRRRHLECPGEKEFFGKGVSYCATCDGYFYKNKDVAVVGGGNTALEDAIFLSQYCRSVTLLIHRRAAFRAEKTLVDAVRKQPEIRCIIGSTVERIEGDAAVNTLILRGGGSGTFRLGVSGVFIAIGYEPDNAWLEGQLPLDSLGYILSDESCSTALPGVFVAGDNRRKILRQLVTAASDGAVAAYQAASYIHLNE